MEVDGWACLFSLSPAGDTSHADPGREPAAQEREARTPRLEDRAAGVCEGKEACVLGDGGTGGGWGWFVLKSAV